MPSATIRLSVDPQTGKRTVTVGYASDLDALPHEHEQAHREIVEKLLEGGIAKPGDTIVVEREGAGVVDGEAAQSPVDEKQRTREGA